MTTARPVLVALVALVALAAPWPAAAEPPATRLLLPIAPLGAQLAAATPTPIVPTATPPVPTATPAPAWRRSDVIVLFLPGLHTTSASTGFAALRAALAADGWPAPQLLDYGYRGGAWTAGGWLPIPYGCGDSLEGLDEARRQLAATLAAIRARLPAARFVLVGHSFGGLAALAHAAAAADPAIVGVVTVDAPLHGVGPGKSTLYDVWPCLGSQARASAAFTVAMTDLEAIYADPVGWGSYWTAAAAWLAGRGVPIATVGNRLDCAYWPSRPGCAIPFPLNLLTFSNDLWTQYVAGYGLNCDADAASWSDTHGAALRAPACLATLTGLVDQAAQPR